MSVYKIIIPREIKDVSQIVTFLKTPLNFWDYTKKHLRRLNDIIGSILEDENCFYFFTGIYLFFVGGAVYVLEKYDYGFENFLLNCLVTSIAVPLSFLFLFFGFHWFHNISLESHTRFWNANNYWEIDLPTQDGKCILRLWILICM